MRAMLLSQSLAVLSSEETPCQPGAGARDLPLLLLYEKRRKIDLKEIHSCLIP